MTGETSTTPTARTSRSATSRRSRSLLDGGWRTRSESHNRWTDERGPVRIDDVRRDMRDWNAGVKTEAYRAERSQTLRTEENPGLDAALNDVEEGHGDIFVRSGHGNRTATFSSRSQSDTDYVDDFTTLEEGMERMLEAVRDYSEERATARTEWEL